MYRRNCFFLGFTELVFSFLLLCACGRISHPGNGASIRILSYNTQTFFDAVDDGREFSQFRGSKSPWTESRYSVRLDRLREVLQLAGSLTGMSPGMTPEIAVFQEIESVRVLNDLAKRLPRRADYPWAVFIPPETGSAFGSALFSRYPVLSVKAHTIDEKTAAVRPVMQISIDAGGVPLEIFCVHWKSKAGQSGTDAVREKQEKQLFELMITAEKEIPESFILACGDFNQRTDEFHLMHAYRNGWTEFCNTGADLFLEAGGGSYYYQGKWERIDHFFYQKNGLFFEVRNFMPVAAAGLTDNAGSPLRYNLYSGTGYSDHLPIILEIKRKN
ncbi:endonuclease [Brucepastera parasyntrophica]|uniref:endonuclease/exonuclease/phosphatase family protein n=1 Tax=Brucepastera parasyntrophica TaxID=2880008 RepID=UPI00210DAFEB|nr:endonuclease/exonuclease/phosphatase family protein [Brucepastera parasyntrophica]ULQ60717.1 endonuclease [Brucepastera parasyntrophica]